MKGRFIQWVGYSYMMIILGVPALGTIAMVTNTPPGWLFGFSCFFAPLVFAFLYVLIAGLLSRPHHGAIIAGKFPRRFDHPVYGPRRLYGLCWTAVYYFTPVYWLFLSVPMLKKMLFRLFGYKGQMDFTIYPDTWIRDLPLLSFGEGAYIANKASLGTNIPLKNGLILVDKIQIGKGSVIGHFSGIGHGVIIGQYSEIGIGGAVGIKSIIGDKCLINAYSVIEHGVIVGSSTTVGVRSYIGSRSHIDDGQVIPGGTVIPRRSHISALNTSTQEQEE